MAELLHAMTAATAAPVSRPPRCACQAMLGTTKPITALIAIVAYMPAEDRPRWRLSTSRAPNNPNTAPEAPTVARPQNCWSGGA